jgi:ABC-type molybdate transport system substrate-binding protein
MFFTGFIHFFEKEYIMRFTETFVSSLVAAAALLSAPFAHAAYKCTTIQGSSGPATPTLNIAVASNLWEPMIIIDPSVPPDLTKSGLVANFLDQNSDETIQVCQDSTANLVAEITTGGNLAAYGLFLAANVKGSDDVCNYGTGNLCLVAGGDLAANPFSYIRGVPALWSPVLGLINISTGVIDLAAVTKVVIADPALAPYGLAGQQIMQIVTQQWSAAQNKLLTPYPTNIDLAYEYIANSTNNAAGYVALSQICRQLSNQPPENYFYASYPTDPNVPPTTGYNPIIQNGAVIDRSIPIDSNAKATAFVNFLLNSDEPDPGPVGGRYILINKFCYQAP